MPFYQQATSTDYRDLLDDLRDFATSDHVATAVVAVAGSTYLVGDILAISGGTSFVAATVEVLTIDGGGGVLTVGIRQSGGYTVNPGSPAATTGGGDNLCTITLTFSGILWTVNRDDQTAPHDATETELQLQGVGSGADEIFVGIRTYNAVSGTVRNWELAGFAGFSSGNTWEDQPGKSPGRFDASTGSAIVPLRDAATITYWFNIDGRRIIVVAKPQGGTYSSCYLGFVNQYATDTEYPYPLLIMGCTSDVLDTFQQTFISYSGISDPIRDGDDGGSAVGPGFLRFTDGSWLSVFNSDITLPNRNLRTRVNIFPSGGGSVTPADTEDQWFGGTRHMAEYIPFTGTPGAPSDGLFRPTPNAGGDLYPMFPCTVVMFIPTRQLIGEMDDVRWFPAAIGPVTAEDTLDSDTFTVFQCGNRSEPWALFAMRTRD